jgi:hypothetical protein
MDPASAGVPAMAVFPAIEIVFEFAERFTRPVAGKRLAPESAFKLRLRIVP